MLSLAHTWSLALVIVPAGLLASYCVDMVGVWERGAHHIQQALEAFYLYQIILNTFPLQSGRDGLFLDESRAEI